MGPEGETGVRGPDTVGEASTSQAWRHFLDRLLLWCAALLVGSGVIFFVAANWSALGRVGRFALLETLIVLALATAAWCGLAGRAGRAALLCASLFTGALLALVGQVYQTGADTWELFAFWALLILPWALLARSAALWWLCWVLVNAAAVLWCGTAPGAWGLLLADDAPLWLLFVLNGSALLAWENALRRGWPGPRGRNGPRLLALAAGASMTLLTLQAIFARTGLQAAPLCWFATLVLAWWLYRRRIPDLFMLAAGLLSLIVVTAVFVAEQLGGEGAFLLVALLVIGLSALGGRWLRQLAAEQGEPSASTLAGVPWYLRLSQGVGGWLAAVFLLAFLGSVFSEILRSASASLLLGVLACAAAWPLMRRRDEFATQFAFAVSLAGQALLGLGFALLWPQDDLRVAWLLACVAGVLFFTHAQFQHRVWALALAAGALAWVLARLQLFTLATPLLALLLLWCWRREARSPAAVERRAAALYALAGMLVAVSVFSSFGQEDLWRTLAGRATNLYLPAWVGGLCTGLLLLRGVALIAQRAGVAAGSPAWRRVLALAAIPAFAGVPAPGFSAALLVLLTGRASGDRVLAGIGLFALPAYLSAWYYALDATLLQKALLLAATGLALFIARVLLSRPSPVSAAGRVSLSTWRVRLALLAGALLLLLVNAAIVRKEQLIATGQPLLLELAPVDPRSLLQGDYMALEYAVTREAFDRAETPTRDGRFVLVCDVHGVGHFRRLDDGRPLAADEFLLRYRVRGGRVQIVGNAFFFEEGSAARYEAARYGELRVAASGDAILVDLRGTSATGE